jgi:hypothetical protein
MKQGEWQTIPEEEAHEWDDLYRETAAFLIRHMVTHAVSIVEFEGERFVLRLQLDPIPGQVN